MTDESTEPTTAPIRMNSDAPRIYHRDEHASVRRGHVTFVDRDHVDELLSEYSYFERLCGTVKSDGEQCTAELPCQWHDSDEDAGGSIDADDSDDSNTDDDENAGSTDTDT